jgi:hypothetical protein
MFIPAFVIVASEKFLPGGADDNQKNRDGP